MAGWTVTGQSDGRSVGRGGEEGVPRCARVVHESSEIIHFQFVSILPTSLACMHSFHQPYLTESFYQRTATNTLCGYSQLYSVYSEALSALLHALFNSFFSVQSLTGSYGGKVLLPSKTETLARGQLVVTTSSLRGDGIYLLLHLPVFRSDGCIIDCWKVPSGPANLTQV